jgi:hypothetical protein
MTFLLRSALFSSLCGLSLVTMPGLLSGASQLDAESLERVCLVATGLGGLPEYDENFSKWAEAVEKLCREDLGAQVIKLEGSSHRRADFQSAFDRISTSLAAEGDCWVFLIGHGSYDGRDYKFNIAGPDLLGRDLSLFLDALGERSSYTILATSSSGVLISKLSGSNRVVVSATKNEREKIAPLFMSFFLEASRSAEADLDKNGSVSLKEAFVLSEALIQDWYEGKKRLQTEHPLLDDEGGRGGLSSVAYLSKPPEQSYRSLEARRLIPERIRLEREIEEIKLRKTEMTEEEYYGKLEEFLIELATLNERIRRLEGRE